MPRAPRPRRDADRDPGPPGGAPRDLAHDHAGAREGPRGGDFAVDDAPASRGRRALLGGAAAGGLAVLVGCAHRRPPPTFHGRRAAHPTALAASGPSPGRWKEQPPPAGAIAVRYPAPSGGSLAWLGRPIGDAPAPALVFFHGEFWLARADFEAVRPFLDAGFAVMTPALRGENGNPGRFELLWGELDDARAAITWLMGQQGIDRRRIYTLGHSVGGGLSALLALCGDLPLRATASAGGIYVPETFVRWAQQPGQRELVRFDPGVADERELRVVGPHAAELVHRHRAYVGRDDRPIARNARAVEALARAHHDRFTVIEVDGDHEAMIKPAVADYLAWAIADGEAITPAPTAR